MSETLLTDTSCEPPRVEAVFTPEDLEREAVYAGGPCDVLHLDGVPQGSAVDSEVARRRCSVGAVACWGRTAPVRYRSRMPPSPRGVVRTAESPREPCR